MLFKFVIWHAGEESILTGTLILFRRSLGLQLVLFPSSVFLSLLLYLWMVLPMYIILPMCIIVHYCIIYWIMNVHLHVYRALSPPWFCRQSPPTTKICPRSDDQNFKSPWLLKLFLRPVGWMLNIVLIVVRDLHDYKMQMLAARWCIIVSYFFFSS